MDSEAYKGEPFSSHYNAESNSEEKPDSAFYGDAIFSGSQDFTVAGGTFTHITNNYHPPLIVPADFRMIPLGDIDLQREIHLNDRSGIVDHQHGRRCARRVYSAKIEGRTSTVTVAMYEGDGAEKEWRANCAKYIAVRHPNIAQLWGVASAKKMHATIFHDDLTPFHQFLDPYQHSHFATVYIFAYTHTEFRAAQDYLKSTFSLDWYYNSSCRLCVRRTVGRLCIDLVPPVGRIVERRGNITIVRMGPSVEVIGNYTPSNGMPPQYGLKSLATLDVEAIVTESLTLDEYHKICSRDLSRTVCSACPLLMAIPGDVVFCPSNGRLEDWALIATLPDVETTFASWWSDTERQIEGELMKDGCIRFICNDVVDTVFWAFDKGHLMPTEPWLSQASYIFSSLGISSNFEDYVALECISYKIRVSAAPAGLPTGFLFLPRPENFRNGTVPIDGPGYWSFDSSGVERIDSADAVKLGFPSLTLSMEIRGQSWDPSVYARLRKFHQAKDFDPESQDVALHLRHPLYQLSGKRNTLFAYIDGEHSCDEDEPDRDSREEESDNTPRSIKPDAEKSNSNEGSQDLAPATLKSVMILQLVLILFLALSGLYTGLASRSMGFK